MDDENIPIRYAFGYGWVGIVHEYLEYYDWRNGYKCESSAKTPPCDGWVVDRYGKAPAPMLTWL